MVHANRRILSALLAICLLLPLFFGLMPARAETVIGREDHQMVEAPAYMKPAAPEVNSDTAILVELNSGVVLYSKNINQRMYPASITKIMTALLALENCRLDDTLVLSHNSVYDLVEGGQDGRGRFYEGQSFSIEDAVYALSLNSVNTVGYALAEHIDGSLDAFSERMNARARELGAINTTFHNPHGLNDLLHMTTAYDMAMIMWGAIQNDLYRKIAGTRSYTFTDNNGNIITCDHNYLVFQPDTDYYDPRIVAGKTGWVEEAEYTRTVYASDGKLDIICVTFHADTTDDAYRDVRNLLDYAFDNFSLVELPPFGEKGELLAAVQDERTGEEGTVRFTASAPRSTTGAAVLVPNEYAGMKWETELIPSEEGGLSGVASLGGVTLGSYPLTVTFVRQTQPATESGSAESSSGTVPPSSTSRGSSSSASGRTEAASESRSTETEPGQSGGSGWKTALIILLGLLLVLALLAAGVLAYQNKVLKERAKRRKVIKKG